MALEHELGICRLGIPELHTTVFRPTENPFSVRRQRNTENKVLVVYRQYLQLQGNLHAAKNQPCVPQMSLYTFHGRCR